MKPVAPPLFLPITMFDTVGARKSGIAVMTFAPSLVCPAKAPWVTPTVADANVIVATNRSAPHLALRALVIAALLGAPDRGQLQHEQQRECAAQHQHEQTLRAGVHQAPAQFRDPVDHAADLLARGDLPVLGSSVGVA